MKLNLKLEGSAPSAAPAGYIKVYVIGDSIKYKNDAGTEFTLATGLNTEDVQDIVGALMTDSSTIDVTYNDAGNVMSFAVIPGGVNHNSLLNGGGTTHTDHAAVSIIAGTGMTGGGDITTSRTLNHANFGTAGTYGSASTVPVITTGATGHVDSVSATAISITSSAVTNFASTVLATVLSGFSAAAGTVAATDTVLQAFQKLQGTITAGVASFAADVRNTVLTGYTVGANVAVAASDSIIGAIQKLQGQIDAINAVANEWTELVTTGDIIVNSNTTLTNVTELAFSVVSGRTYYIECTVKFRAQATTTGITLTIGTSNTAAGDLACQVNIPIAADGTAAIFGGSISSLGDVVTSTGVQTAQPTWFCANIKGAFVCTASGTLVPQFRSEVNGSNVNFGTGSIILVREFA